MECRYDLYEDGERCEEIAFFPVPLLSDGEGYNPREPDCMANDNPPGRYGVVVIYGQAASVSLAVVFRDETRLYVEILLDTFDNKGRQWAPYEIKRVDGEAPLFESEVDSGLSS